MRLQSPLEPPRAQGNVCEFALGLPASNGCLGCDEVACLTVLRLLRPCRTNALAEAVCQGWASFRPSDGKREIS